MWQQVYQHGAAQRQSETLQRFLNGTCLYLAELDRAAVKPWRICRVHTQAGGERGFPVWRLTSPVTKCLPSGEKDRAVICFLLIREEESKVWGWLVKINGKPIQRMLFVHWKLTESWSCFPIRVAFLQLLMTGFIILMWCVPLLSAECVSLTHLGATMWCCLFFLGFSKTTTHLHDEANTQNVPFHLFEPTANK